MNEEFEVMPFAAAGQQMERQIGRLNASARTSARAGRTMGRRVPRWGWPYPAAVSYPTPYWFGPPAAVAIAPEPFPVDWTAEPPAEEADTSKVKQVVALPRRLKAAVEHMPAARRPQYRYLGTVSEALASLPAQPRTRGAYAGLYLLVFGPEGKESAYSGQSGDVRRRILQHKLFGHMLGRDIGNFRVFVHPMPGSGEDKRRALELGLLTNQKQEFEAG